MMKHYRERDIGRDPDGDREAFRPHFAYGRPSVSAWIAAAAVAVAVFLLGGFIKTHRQLDQLQEESRAEIADLRGSLRRMQDRLAAAPAPARGRQPLPSIDEAARQERELAARRESLPSPPSAPQFEPLGQFRSDRTAGAASASAAPSFDESGDRGIRYQWGRTSGAPASRTLIAAGNPSQVVSVSAANRRVMIEGGRDVALTEGERLELARDGRWIADLRVQDVFGNQSLCEVLHATQPPRPGDTVRLPETSM